MAKKRKKKGKRGKGKKTFNFTPKEGIEAALDRRALVRKIQGELKGLE
jgi:hypothetical protein